MRYHNTVLHDILKHVPWAAFDKLVDEHRADARSRQLNTKGQLVALLYAQLSGASSLREIEASLSSHSNKLYHLGGQEVSRSTLADANAQRPSAVFSGLFSEMLKLLGRGERRSVADAVRLIDSTGVRLAGLAAQWARFSKGVCGAKVHVVFDPDAEAPIYHAVTAARVNDITAAQAMPVEAGATYVFDLGYYNYAFWAKLDRAGCRFVTRLKKNTPLVVVAEEAVPDGGSLMYDRIGHLPERLAASRKNPFADPVREIGVRLDDGKTILRVVTNDLDAPAEEIAALYKRRWAIELFFRWVKQTLKIRHFLGRSENAVRIQIAVALIAYLLLKLAKEAGRIPVSLLCFARLVRANVMHRRRIDQLHAPPPQPSTMQLSFSLLRA